MGDQVSTDLLGRAEDSLEEALEDVDSPRARYHIRQAAQRVEMSRWMQRVEG